MIHNLSSVFMFPERSDTLSLEAMLSKYLSPSEEGSSLNGKNCFPEWGEFASFRVDPFS